MFIPPHYLKPALAAAALVFVGATAYQSGRHHAQNRCDAQVAKLRETHASALLKAEQHYTAALQQHAAQYQVRLRAVREADKNLFAATAQARTESANHKKEIPPCYPKRCCCRLQRAWHSRLATLPKITRLLMLNPFKINIPTQPR